MRMTLNFSLHFSPLDMHAIEEIILQTLHFDKYCGNHHFSPLSWALISRLATPSASASCYQLDPIDFIFAHIFSCEVSSSIIHNVALSEGLAGWLSLTKVENYLYMPTLAYSHL